MIKFVLDNVGTADTKCILIRCNLLNIYMYISVAKYEYSGLLGGATLHCSWDF